MLHAQSEEEHIRNKYIDKGKYFSCLTQGLAFPVSIRVASRMNYFFTNRSNEIGTKSQFFI